MDNSPFNTRYQIESSESKIVVALERISEAFRVLLWREGQEYKLSPLQVQVLIFIHHHTTEKCKVGYLAKEFNMTKATLSDAVKTLVNKGLVVKHFNEPDARSFTLSLSSKGKEMAEKTSHFTKELQSPLDQLSSAELEELLEHLLAIIKHLNKAGIISVQRMCFSCKYYANSNGQQYCNLLNASLKNSEIRLDCPEHEDVAA